jgi:hypothetical protein
MYSLTNLFFIVHHFQVVLMLLFVAREAVSDVVYGDPPKNLP